jgi:hypothetical protein
MTRSQEESADGSRPTRRLWRAYFNAPLYVPPEAYSTLRILKSRGRDAFVAELERLSSLGSPSASALLGILCLTPGSDGTRNTERAIELSKSHADSGDAYSQFVYAWALMFSKQPNPAIATINKAAVRLFPPATIDLVTFLWSSGGREHRHAPLAMKALQLAVRSGHKSAMLWRCALYRSGHFGFWLRLVGVVLTPIAFSKLVISSLFFRPFSAQVFSFPARLKRPLLESEAKFSLYNELGETPELDRRRTFHRYLLALVHLVVALAAVIGGYVYRRPDTESPSTLAVAVLMFPYLASAAYSIRVVSYQRLRLVLFVFLLIGGAMLTGAFIAGAFSSIDSFTAFIDILGFESGAFIWGAELLLHVV